MAEITTIIYEYMQHNRRLTIPELGSFLSRGEGQGVIFSEFAKGDDGALRCELVRRGATDLAAAAAIDDFVESTKARFEEGGSLFIAGVGVLRLDAKCCVVLDGAECEVEVSAEQQVAIEVEVEPNLEIESGVEPENESEIELELESESEPEPKLTPKPKLDFRSYYEHEPKFEPEPKQQLQGEKTTKKRKIDPLMVFLVIAICVALGFFIQGFIIGWQIGEIRVPAQVDRVMIKIFGDGFDEVESADEFPMD